MATLNERAIVVFTLDKNDLAIPDVLVEVIINDRVFVNGTTQGYIDKPIRLGLPSGVDAVTLRATVMKKILTATVAADVGTYTFKFDDIEVKPLAQKEMVPTWFAKAGFGTGAATLLFFMYVALGPL